MKQAISGTWVYVTVLIFMVILIAYVTISINYANAYELSEQVIQVIEQYEGFNKDSMLKMDKILGNSMHTSKGACNSDEVGVYTTEHRYEKDPKKSNYDMCIKKTKGYSEGAERYYYETTIFFSFNLPVLGDLFTFKIPGETAGMRNVTDYSGVFE